MSNVPSNRCEPYLRVHDVTDSQLALEVNPEVMTTRETLMGRHSGPTQSEEYLRQDKNRSHFVSN